MTTKRVLLTILILAALTYVVFANSPTTIIPNEGIGQYKLNISYTDLEKSVGKPDEITEVQSDMALLIYDKDNIQVLLELNNSSENELRTRTLAIRTENPAHVFGKDKLHVGDTVTTLVKSMGEPDRIVKDGQLVQFIYEKQYVLSIVNNTISGIIVWHTPQDNTNSESI